MVLRLLSSHLTSVRSVLHVQKCRRDDEILPVLFKEQQCQDSAGDSVGSGVHPGCVHVCCFVRLLFCGGLILLVTCCHTLELQLHSVQCHSARGCLV